MKSENTGAPDALKWIADNEAKSRKEVEEAIKAYNLAVKDEREQPANKDGTEWARVRGAAKQILDDAEERQFKYLKQLLLFDKNVAPEKRDASESITRDEGEKTFKMIAIYLRTANESFLTRAIPEIREAKSNELAYKVAATAYGETLKQAIKSGCGEAHLPSWVLAAVEGVL